MTKLQFSVKRNKHDKLLAYLMVKGTFNPATKTRYVKKENLVWSEVGRTLGKHRHSIRNGINKLIEDGHIIDKGEIYEFPVLVKGEYVFIDMELLERISHDTEAPDETIFLLALMTRYKALNGTFTKKYVLTHDFNLTYTGRNLERLNAMFNYLNDKNIIGVSYNYREGTKEVSNFSINFVAETVRATKTENPRKVVIKPSEFRQEEVEPVVSTKRKGLGDYVLDAMEFDF